MARLVLAATLAANYGIYGPAFELLEHVPREPGSEEYLDSEKYQVRALGPRPARQPAPPHRARERDPPRQPGAAGRPHALRFLPVDNDQLIAYAKATDDGDNVIAHAWSTSIRSNAQSRLGRARPRPRSAIEADDALPGARPAERRSASSGTARATSSSSTRRHAGARLRACAAACAASATSTTSSERSADRT